MKKLWVGLAVAACLIVIAVVAAPVLIPSDLLKQKIAAAVLNRTGRELRIAGAIKVSLVPNVRVVANDVTLANAPGGVAPNLLELKTIEASVRLLPLLRGRVEADQVTLTQPRVNLEIDKEGRRNWLFRPIAKPATTPAPPVSRSEPFTVSVEQADLFGGEVGYLDQRHGKRQSASAIALTASRPDPAGPTDIAGSALWNGETVRFAATAASFESLRHGGASAATLHVESAPVSLDFKGEITGGKAARAAGAIVVKASALRRLLAWVQASPPETDLGALSVEGTVEIGAAKIALADATIALGTIAARGNLTLDRAGARPALSGQLALDALDLDPFLTAKPDTSPSVQPAPGGALPSAPTAPAAPSQAPSAAGQAPPQPAAPQVAAAAPVDGVAPKTLDAALGITANSVHFRRFEGGRSVFTLHLADRRLDFDVAEMSLYGGKGSGKVAVDDSGPVPAIAANISLAGVEVQPLLLAVSRVDPVSGKGDLVFDLRARGNNAGELVASLTGTGRIDLANGRISGLIANPFAVAPPTSSGNNELKYASFTASYGIASGVLKTDDLKLNSPELASTGSGTVHLAPCQVEFLWLPNLIGKGSADIEVTGPCDNLAFLAKSVTITKGLNLPKLR